MFALVLGAQVEGYVVGEGGEPLVGAVVVAHRLPDSTKAGGTYADRKGFFRLNLEDGEYLLRISFVGYDERYIGPISVKGVVSLGQIRLKAKAIEVKAVEVEGEAPQISYEGEKKVIRFNRDLTSKGGNALDALRNVPGITVDNNDNVKIRNTSNITLLINGRPSLLEPSEALRQIPASQIERVEIITNPSAKYEAQGGVIMNVVLKKNTREGVAASLMGRLGTYDNYGGSASLGWNTSKLKTTFSVNYFVFTRFMVGTTYVRTPFYSYTSGGLRHYRMRPYGVKGSAEYHLSEKDVLSLEGSLGMWNFGMGWDATYEDRKTRTLVDMGGMRASAFLGYDREFSPFHRTGLSVYYGVSDRRENTENRVEDGSGSPVSGFKRLSDGPHKRWRFKLDHTWQQDKDRKLEVGYQGDIFYYYDSTLYYTLEGGDYRLDTSAASSMVKNVHAGYLSYSNRFHRLTYQVGVRVERVDREVKLRGESYPYVSTDVFPSLHLSYNLDVLNQFQFSYSRRIWHPRHWQLNPFKRVLDERSLQRGNPSLKPEYTNSYELGYQRVLGKTGTFGVETFYRRTVNDVSFLPDLEGGKVVYTWKNAGYTLSAGAEVYTNLQPLKFLSLNLSLSLYEHRVYYDSLSRNFTYDFKGSVTLGRGPVGLQVSGRYSAPRYVPGGRTKERYSLDLGLRLPLSRSLFVVAQFNDFLRMSRWDTEVEYTQLYQRTVYRRRWPSISVMLMYDYNNFRRFMKPKREETSEEQEVPQF